MRLRRLVFAAFALVLVACADSSGESTTTSASTGEASTSEASTIELVRCWIDEGAPQD